MYIIIDTNIAEFSNSELEAAVNGETPEMEESSGRIASLLKRSCFLKLIYYQMSDYMSGQADGIKLLSFFRQGAKQESSQKQSGTADAYKDAAAATAAENGGTLSEEEQNDILLDMLFAKMSSTAATPIDVPIIPENNRYFKNSKCIWI